MIKSIILLFSIFIFSSVGAQVSIKIENFQETETLNTIYQDACNVIYQGLISGKLKAWNDREMQTKLTSEEIIKKFTYDQAVLVLDGNYELKDSTIVIEGDAFDIQEFDLVNDITLIRISLFNELYVKQKDLRKFIGSDRTKFFLHWMNLSSQTSLNRIVFASEPKVLRSMEKKIFLAIQNNSLEAFSADSLQKLNKDQIANRLIYQAEILIFDTITFEEVGVEIMESSYTAQDITGIGYFSELEGKNGSFEIESNYVGLLIQPMISDISLPSYPVYWCKKKSVFKLFTEEELYFINLCTMIHLKDRLNSTSMN